MQSCPKECIVSITGLTGPGRLTAGELIMAVPAINTPQNPVIRWLDERLGIMEQDYPVPAHSMSLLHSLGMLTLAAFVLLSITGLYLLQFTSSAPESARDSLMYLVTRVEYGNFVRSVHFWAGNLMVVTATLHLLRVFWSGSYKRPREMQWVIGVFLLTVIVMIYFTGTVIKWDQVGYEALVHNQDILGFVIGPLMNILINDPSGITPFMTKLYRFHTIIFPALFMMLLLPHLLLVKRNHVAPLPERSKYSSTNSTEGDDSPDVEQTTFFRIQMIHVGYCFLFAAVVALLALAYPPSIGPKVILGVEITRPAWVFWYTHAIGNQWGLIPLTVGTLISPVILLLVPFLDRSKKLHILDRKRMAIAAIIVILLWVALTSFVGFAAEHQHIGV